MDEKSLAKMVREAVKEELNAFKQEVATKEDFKKLRADVMTEIKAIRSEMVTRDDLRIYITKEDFDTFIKSISERLESFSERTLMLLKHYESDVREVHRRFDMIDFGLLLTHLDRLAGTMEKREQERILAENQLKRHYLEIKERLIKLEALTGA